MFSNLNAVLTVTVKSTVLFKLGDIKVLTELCGWPAFHTCTALILSLPAPSLQVVIGYTALKWECQNSYVKWQ